MSTDIAIRRLVDAIKTSNSKSIASASTSIAADVQSALSEDLTLHTAKNQFVHGVGPLFVAKTSNPAQYVRWSEIADKPDLSDLDIDLSGAEFDASQITTGTLALARLAIAASGENSATKLVRADDVRLGGGTGQTFSAPVGVALDAGDYVTAYNDAGTTKLMPASSISYTTRPIGYVLSAYAVGTTGVVYPTGVNDQAFIELTPADIPAQVFLTLNGKVSTDPAGMPFVMPVGVAQSYISATRASIQTRYEMIMEILPDPMLTAIRENEADYAWYAGAGWSATRWTDVMHGVVATSASPPTWSATGIGGKPAASFDGSQELSIGTSIPIDTYDGYALVAVFSTASSIPTYQGVFGAVGGGITWLNGPCASASYKHGWGGTGSVALASPSNAYATNTAYVVTWDHSRTGWTVTRNGTSGSFIADAVWPTVAPVLTIGARAHTTPYRYTGPIALIAIFSGANYAARAAATAAAAQSWYGGT